MSGFRSMHPAVTIVYYAGLLAFTLLLFHPLFLITEIAALTGLLVLQGQGRTLVRSLPFVLIVAVPAALLNPLFSHRGAVILFYFMDQPVTLEAVLYGLMMMLVLLSVIILFLSYNYTVTPDRFLYLFGSAAPTTALLALMTLRFVPLFQRRLRKITLVQGTRGITVSKGNLRARMASGMTLLKTLLTWSLEEALQTADSMKARGYGICRRSSYAVHRLERRDRAALIVLGATAAGILWGWYEGFGFLMIYPRMRPHVFTTAEAGMYAAFCFFTLLPLWVEGKEIWLWKYSARRSFRSAIPRRPGLHWTDYRSE
ncbi:energy-coupling factor transporter transmembrane protein EcfT [Paenibacillus sp. HN-1]|uniref:energy-coupling factor transporter transmembrane component T n=1 Tax=Paenibacillus TaxID=44249 RepID=UPI001CA9AB10|nr:MULTISPECIES: energy-coupling factor transporter transmembrane component T [Paenibacillus]MBY9077460.1 energy-coupling factor transporter transmembrane protein EcfT [Paenibacillus sp. CGMCC 1.18879]MBY9084763.1 energy-coupling factor transporter transmembrane protein EcfT [Paenibacillus sinensis]